ncbi:uncharacterized protein LOC132619928 [Lycium barbarum]|uniref:uncharacterized protein LOC132619928 n=1 Tax=Lycium barbarum TaxID=112863 RepID=UPI00293E87BE|nr:uncharacterized protein LOC132619928 [Lycium barbarum]
MREKRTRDFPEEDLINFSDEDAVAITLPHNDTLVITVFIGCCRVKHVMVDPGSSANILHWKAVEEMGLLEKIIPAARTLVSFNMSSETTKGEIDLPVEAGGVIKVTKLYVIDGNMQFNAIFGRPWLHDMKDLELTLVVVQQIPSENKNNVGPKEVEEGYGVPRYFHPPDDSDVTKSTVEELKQVALHLDQPERKVYLSTGLTPELREVILNYLRHNIDCFVWSHKDITGIPSDMAIHKLGLDFGFPPVRQKRWPIAEVQNRFVKEEVSELVGKCSRSTKEGQKIWNAYRF